MTNLPVKKKRSKKWIFFLIILVTLISAVFIGVSYYKNSLGAPSNDPTVRVFVVNPKETVAQIVDELKSKNLIKNSFTFKLYLKQTGLDGKIQTGDFKLRGNMTAREIVETLTHGVIDVWVTFPEGWRIEEMAKQLHDKLGINESDFINEAKEGYMFPDTYLLPKDATAGDIVKIMTGNFHKRLKDNNLAEVGSKDLTFDDRIILASLIERETKDGLEERMMIAGILLNRLRIGMALQVDASVQYDQGTAGNWWPTLTPAELKMDSPSNTYVRPGLPPGPISNPGIESIKAVFNPTPTDNLYYIHDKNGAAHYAETLEEHNANVAKYLR